MAKIAKAAGTEHQVVGKVFILYGTVQAVSPDGTVRILAPNSPVYADDHIITGSDGSVSIQFDGPPVTQLDLGRMTEIVIDEDVYAGVTPEAVAESAAEAEQVHQSLLEGDQEIDMEATAAGGSTGAGGGHPVVIFTLDGNEGYITSGADTAAAGSATSIDGVIDQGAPSIPLVSFTTPINVSGINTDLSVNEGDTISFSWSFDTNDTLNGNDFGFVVINGTAFKLADSSQVGNDNSTGWGVFTHVATETGPLNISFGVMNTDNSAGDSHLLIDKLTVNYEVVKSFESGDLTGWGSTGNGNVTVVTSHGEGGATPADGTHMGKITSTSTSDLSKAELQDFFGLSAEELYAVWGTPTDGSDINVEVDTTPTDGSAISTELSVQAGDKISFNWSFDADDYTPFNDFGFVVVNGGVAKLADISQVGSGNATGWGTVTFTAIETGTLQIGFGVMNTGDFRDDSHLLIDRLTVNGEVVKSFESGDLAGWDSTGNVTVVRSHDEGGGTPIHGTHMVRITSTSDALDVDLASVPKDTIEGFFHLHEGTMDSLSATRLGKLAWATADDEGLAEGNPGEQGPPPEVGHGGEGGGDILVDPDPDYNEATFSGTLPHNFGPDGPGGVGFGAMNGQTGMVGIEEVTYAWDNGTNTLTATGPRGALFTVEVDPLSGNYTLTLKENVLHNPPVDGHSTENNSYVQQLTYTVTDADGDHVNGTLNIMINDDMPLAVDQTITLWDPPGGDLGSFGADGGHVKSIEGTDTTNIDITPDEAGKLTVTGQYGGTLVVDSSDASYIYTPPAVIPEGYVTERFGITLIDGDGDTASAQLSILIEDPYNFD